MRGTTLMARQVTNQDPHGEARVVLAGTPLDRASGALIAIHGRGATADDIVALAREIAPPGIAIVAPQAAGNTWYRWTAGAAWRSVRWNLLSSVSW